MATLDEANAAFSSMDTVESPLTAISLQRPPTFFVLTVCPEVHLNCILGSLQRQRLLHRALQITNKTSRQCSTNIGLIVVNICMLQ